MNHTTSLRILQVSLLLMIGVWAGFRFHHGSKSDASLVAVPVGKASAPTPSDLISEVPLQGIPIPEQLPPFTINNLQGKPTTAAAWPGKSLIMNFWATWCAPCQREVPLLKALSTEWAGRGIEVVGVAVDHVDKVQGFAEQFKIGYPLLVGEQDALDLASQLGLTSPVFPFTVFTDHRGRVVALFIGELHREQANLILSVLQDLNQDKVPLLEARRQIADGLGKMTENRSG
jgi:thiol-disulfide isomerase/thioredoxin